MKRGIILVTIVLWQVFLCAAQTTSNETREAFLSWNAIECEKIGKAWRANGTVGGSSGIRVRNTDRAINYKLRATLMTPEVIRAAARLEQIRNRLSDEQTMDLVLNAENAADLVVMIELDPNEGSGVIPLDWRVIMQPNRSKAGAGTAITGLKEQNLRAVKALAGVFRRDYDYDVFWVSFPFLNEYGQPNFPDDVTQLELIVGIYEKEGRVLWTVPDSLRARMKAGQKTGQ